jgi:hypothetical protein
MPVVGSETTILVFEWEKMAHAFDRAVTLIDTNAI